MSWFYNILLLCHPYYFTLWPIIASCTPTFVSTFQSEERKNNDMSASLHFKEIPQKCHRTVPLTHISQDLVTWSHLAAGEAGSCCPLAEHIAFPNKCRVLLLRKRERMDIVPNTVLFTGGRVSCYSQGHRFGVRLLGFRFWLLPY